MEYPCKLLTVKENIVKLVSGCQLTKKKIQTRQDDIYKIKCRRRMTIRFHDFQILHTSKHVNLSKIRTRKLYDYQSSPGYSILEKLKNLNVGDFVSRKKSSRPSGKNCFLLGDILSSHTTSLANPSHVIFTSPKWSSGISLSQIQ